MLDRAEIVVQEACLLARLRFCRLVPLSQKLQFPKIIVDWEPAEQRFITAAEKFLDGTTARVRAHAILPIFSRPSNGMMVHTTWYSSLAGLLV